jgi:hypothetical protein
MATGKPAGKIPIGDLSVDGRMILKLAFKKENVKTRSTSFGSGHRRVSSSCETVINIWAA